MTLSERIMEMSDAGMSPRAIAIHLKMDGQDVNRTIYRMRRRRAEKLALEAEA